jgi:hypothetical protein
MTARPLIARVPWPADSIGEVPYDRPAARKVVTWTCQRGHRFTTVFAATADVPEAWECRCGKPAGITQPEAGQTEHERRMEQVLGRRTPAQLEELLAERISAIRGG